MNISLGQLKKGENQTTSQIFKSLNIPIKTLNDDEIIFEGSKKTRGYVII